MGKSAEAHSGKILKLTGQTVTELLNNQLLSIVNNDPRKTLGVTAKIKAFINTVKHEYAENADPRRGIEKMMLERKEMSENVPTSRIASARKYLKRRASVMVTSGGHHRFMSEPDAKALERALEVSNRRKAKRNRNRKNKMEDDDNIESQIDKMVVKVYEARLRRIMFFIEGVNDLILKEHLGALMAQLPPIPRAQRHDKTVADKFVTHDAKAKENLDDPREDIVKHSVLESVESAICGPVKSILFYYSTKVGSAADLDMKIVSKIAYLKSRFSPGKIPQTIFGVNHVSPSNWQLAIDRLSVVEQCELADAHVTRNAVDCPYHPLSLLSRSENRIRIRLAQMI